jgi:enterochelin esterase family protein
VTASDLNKVDAVPPANLLERAQRGGNPVIEGSQAWFVWQGEQPVSLNGDFTDWATARDIQLRPAGENLWAACLEFLPDAYIEYSYFEGEKRLVDPLNPRRTPNGLGKTNQFFYMPQGHPTPLILRRPGIAPGKLTHHRLDAGEILPGGTRAVSLYQPPVDWPCPLMVIYDGEDYLKRGKIIAQVENLVAMQRIRHFALAFISAYPAARNLEYACNDLTLAFLADQLIPFARQRLNLTAPGTWGVMGASMGGLMALYTAMRMPETFGMVLSQSGAFLSFGGPDPLIFDLVDSTPLLPLRIWMDVGKYEWILPHNQSMRSRLEKKGYSVGYREFSGGHNYPSWRNDLHHGLEWLLPAVTP